jgi:tetratricopeptide (TPR) repeat protein
MEHDQLSVARRFVDDLQQLRQLAGRPSYSTLERLSGHRLKRATMSDVLNGNRVNLPDWRFVHEFVAACQAAATENRLDANELGTVADWKRHWDGASSGVIDARFPGRDSQPFGRQEPDSVPWQAASAPAEATGSTAISERPAGDPEDAVARPVVWGPVPARLPDFVGREAWLETLRQAVTRDGRVGVVAIQGLSGVGKTQIAIEYANRHANEYDLVWWIPCDDAEAALGGLADLAARAGATDVAQLSDVLRRRERYPRWLLIFDNVHDPGELMGLIPALAGDVLVTTRSSRWEASGELLELDVFDRTESIEFLRRRMPRFTAVAAHRLAEGVGDLPLLLEHAVESRVPVNEYLTRLDSEPLGLLDDQPADYHAAIASAWLTAASQLRAEAPDAYDLLQCLAFFGTDPVPRESLERGSYLADISMHAMLRDPVRLARAIGKLRRAGLVRMGPGTRSLSVHRVTQCVTRELTARSGAAEAERVRHDVHLLLAAADPLTPENPATWRSYEELRAHAAASGVIACPQELVRRFVVNLARYLNVAGDPHAAVTLADEALARWDADASDGSPGRSDCRMAMRMAEADALFALGKRTEAFQLRQEALAAMRSDPGRWTAEIIDLEGTSGARYRIAGNFKEALAADQESVRAHVVEFGDDDPRTFNAVNSFITDLVLSGEGAQATAEARRTYRNCLAFYSDASHPAVLAARHVLGRCRWQCGEYDEAAGIMAEVHGGYEELAGRRSLDQNHPWRLAHDIDYAIARRDMGPRSADLQLLADDMQEIRRRCWRTLGADHPQTLAATVVLGSILRRIGSRTGEAVRTIEEAERRYQSALPGHPYGQACRAFLAAVRCEAATGSSQRVAARSVLVIQDVIDHLADLVGDAHPMSLVAVSALANALARAGELDAAIKHGHKALVGFRDLLGPDHPHTLIVKANNETIESRLAPAPAPSPPRRLVEIDFTPLPLLPGHPHLPHGYALARSLRTAGSGQSGSVRGSPKMRSMLLSGNPVTVLTWLPARVSTIIPLACETGARGSRM